MSAVIEPSRYKPAAVCRRGHVESINTETRTEIAPRCAECGAEILTGCPSCGGRIRGHFSVPGVIGFGGSFEPPRFCDFCGAPFPWLDRQGRIYELENLLTRENLDPADELTVKEQLEALANPDLDEEEAKRRWQRVKRLAPGLWESGKPILDSVVSAAIKAQLGL
jgi:hypothetical protein